MNPGVIEKLRKEDIEKTAKVYNKGLTMQIPRSKSTLKKTLERLNQQQTFVYKDNEKIKGLVSFETFKEKNRIKMRFIYADKLRKGIGRKLMKALSSYASRNKVKDIISEVSSKDKRVVSFYKACGFKKYGEHRVTRNFLLFLVKAKPNQIKKALK